jgi:hypothetical protein
MVDLLVIVRPDSASRYYQNLALENGFNVQIAHTLSDCLSILADPDEHTDALILDNTISGVDDLVSDLRHSYPRLLIILVDEESDFGMPGQADDISTEPLHNNDLARRIQRLMSDRQMETLRSDSLPAVRSFAKQLRGATGVIGKQQAAVNACLDMGYEYVAYFQHTNDHPLTLHVRAEAGQSAIQAIAPKVAGSDDLMSWVLQNGQSRVAGPEDKLNHPLVSRGRLGSIACVPVTFNQVVYGVMVACRDRPGSINQEHVVMLELVSAQLAGALSKETMP